MNQYVMRIVCCALICGALAAISGSKCGSRKIVYSLFLAFMVISPLRTLELGDFVELPEILYQEGEDIRDAAVEEANSHIQSVIKEELESYILVEAGSLGMEVQIDRIELVEESMLPLAVYLSGNVGSYEQCLLSVFMEQKLGISQEGQIWNADA